MTSLSQWSFGIIFLLYGQKGLWLELSLLWLRKTHGKHSESLFQQHFPQIQILWHTLIYSSCWGTASHYADKLFFCCLACFHTLARHCLFINCLYPFKLSICPLPVSGHFYSCERTINIKTDLSGKLRTCASKETDCSPH